MKVEQLADEAIPDQRVRMSDDLRRAKTHWEHRIEHMLTRPLMFTANANAFECAFHTALEAWEAMDRASAKKSGRSALAFVWRHVLKDAHGDHGRDFKPSVAAFYLVRDRDSGDRLDITDVVPYLRLVWERLRDPIERLASISEDDGG